MTKAFILFVTAFTVSVICKFEDEEFDHRSSQPLEEKQKKEERINQTSNLANINVNETIEYTRLGVPKIIWTYWNSEIKEDNHFHKLFMANRKRFTKGWIVRQLNELTVWYWLNQIPDFDDALNRPEFKNQVQAKRADLIRFALLKHFGGVYMDFTTILIENLDWIENLDQQQTINYRFGDAPDVFFMYSSEHTDRDSAIAPQTGKKFYTNPTLEVFFVIAKPKSRFLQQLFDCYVQSRKKSFQMYGDSRKQSYLLDIREKQNFKTGGFYTSYFEISIAASIILQKKQRLLDELFQNGTDQVQRYAVKQYGLWVMGTNVSAYYYDYLSQQQKLILTISQTDLDLLKGRKLYPKYYLKLYSKTAQQLNNFLLRDQQIVNRLSCKWDFYILENSFVKKFLLDFYDKKFYYNPVLNNPFPHNCLDLTNDALHSSTRKNNFNCQTVKKVHLCRKIKKVSDCPQCPSVPECPQCPSVPECPKIEIPQCPKCESSALSHIKESISSSVPNVEVASNLQNENTMPIFVKRQIQQNRVESVNVLIIVLSNVFTILLTLVSIILILMCSPKLQEKLLILLQNNLRENEGPIGNYDVDRQNLIDS